MSNQVVSTEEVRGALLEAPEHGWTVSRVAQELIVNVSTVRRHLDMLVDRGQVARTRLRPYGRRLVAFYALTPEGREAERTNEGF